MKKILFIAILCFLNIGCSSLQGIDFELTKKHPQTIPNMEISFLSDTSATVFKTDDKSITQNIQFVRKKRYYLVITSIEKENSLVELEKGDTIVLYKKELIFSNEKHKLVFKKKNK